MNETPVITAFLDANVMYPALLRNILMRLAMLDLYRPRWSRRVHDEWTSALLRNRPDLTRARIERARDMMDEHIDDALVKGFEGRIDALTLPDRDDRHVLAAAIHCNATVIVTTNIRDFPPDSLYPFGIETIHPDLFILGFLKDDRAAVVTALSQILEAYKNPAVTAAQLLAMMRRHNLVMTADAIHSANAL